MMFTFVVNGALFGLFVGVLLATNGVDVATAWVVGTVCAAGYSGISLWLGARIYFRFWREYTPLNPGVMTDEPD
jgi:hypothetical protein